MSATPGKVTPKERRKMCTGKRRYPTEGRAMNGAISSVRHGYMGAARVYHCPLCDGYHLTSRLRLPTG